MGSIDDIMQLCRLCLVKDQVNIPIFDETSDIRQTFLKINSCLPVKVSRDDNLPKKICDGCSYKLDMLYIFRNTSVDSEKQLLSWLNEAGLTSLSQAVKDGAKPEVMVKQETFETNDARIEENPEMGADAHGEISLEAQHPDMGVGAHSYIMQQQKLPYQQDFSFGEPSGSTAGLISEEPSPKRIKRAASVKKHVPLETEEEEEEELEAALQVTKAEEEDSDDVDQPDYIEAPSTSADDQPGPSGVGKGTIEAPSPTSPIKQEFTFELVELPLPESPLLWEETVPQPIQSEPQFICETCGRKYPTKRKLGRHKQHHKEKRHSCDVCLKKFVTPCYLRVHKKQHEVTGFNYNCDVCRKAFKTERSVERHKLIHTKDYKFKCDLCSFGCMNQRALQDHKMVVHEDVRFTCEICNKMFKDKYYFKAHAKTHDPNYVKKTWTCKICQKVFDCRPTYRRHMANHEDSRQKYICEVCGKCYISRNFLTNHMRTHTGQKMCICEVCGKGFILRERLKEHMRVHTKERPYVCTVCSKGFTQKGSLNIHMRTHTGKKPYKCSICTKGFITKAALKTHKCLFHCPPFRL